MAKAQVLSWEKKKIGEVDLADAVFAAPVNKSVLHSVVRWQLAGRRQGTHKAKTKGEVSGSGKKPFKQKGTGNARQGMIRSPLFPKGGITFGPRPRDYSFSLPKKVRQLGLRSALSQLNGEGKLYVVESMNSEGKTKELASRLKGFGLEKAVLIDSKADTHFQRAVRNLPKVRYYTAEGLNAYDLLKYGTVVITKDSIDRIVERCGVGG